MNSITARLSCVLICFIFHSAMNAQNIKVTVIGDNEPLGFAYLSINHQYVCMSDSLGVAYIPVGKLNLNDTIHAKFIGMDGVGVVYNNSVKSKQSCVIKLQTKPIYIDEVGVMGYVDAMKKLKQSVIFREIAESRSIYDIGLAYSEISQSKSIECSGNMRVQYITDDDKSTRWLYKISKSDLNCSDDTRNNVAVILLSAFNTKLQPYNVWLNEPTPKYLGEDDTHITFSLIFYRIFKGQYLIKVNKRTKTIEEIESYNIAGDCIYKVNLILNKGKEIASMNVAIKSINIKGEMKDVKLNIHNINVIPPNRTKQKEIDSEFTRVRGLL